MSFSSFAGLFAGYSAALALLARKIGRPHKSYLPEKTLCSLCFILVAALSARLGHRQGAFWHLAPALVCCLAGDVLLAVYNRSRKLPVFVTGGLCFLAGHALFVWGLCRLQPADWLPVAAALAGALGTVLLHRYAGLRFGRLFPLAVLYAAFVSAFVGKSAQLAAGTAQPWSFLVLAGAALFWVSDLLIMFLYFHEKPHPAVHAANLLTYYYGMFLIAVSLGF